MSAAERVSLTQAAVSQQMRMIEEALGRKLFDRRGRQIALTNEGHEVCAKVERILTLIDGLYTTQDESMDGQVSIGAVVSVIGALSLAIAGLKREHPALDVRLTSARSNELAQMVLDGEIDMAAVVEHTGETLTENLVWTPLYDEPLILVASSEVSDDDPRAILSASSYLGFDRRVRTGVIIERALQTLGLGVREYLELNSIETIVSLVRNNVGVSVLPLLRGAGWQTDPLLRILPLCAPALTRSVGIVQRKSHVRTRLTQAISAALIAP